MIDKLLISQDDIGQYFTVAELPDGRLDPDILRAQQLDLKPVLNDALYYDLMTKYDDAGDDMYDAYQALINGGVFSYGGSTIEFCGIKPMLACYAMARFLPHNPINITRYGVVTKVIPQSQPVEQATISYMVKQINSDAVAYQNEVKRFLEQNVDTYTLYNSMPGSSSRTGGVKIFRAGEGRAANSQRGRGMWHNGVYYPNS